MLYKFFTLNDNSLSSLYDTSLWFSKISEFNDPFEGRVKLETKILDNGMLIKIINGINDKGELNEYFKIKNKTETNQALTQLFLQGKSECLKKKLNTVIQSGFNAIIESYNQHGVCCFISNVGNAESSPPLENRLMWSHYANGLRGFLLEFTQDRLFDLENNKIDGPFIVDYTNNYPVIDLIDFASQYYVFRNKEYTDKYIELMIKSKNLDWKYESEVRYTNPNGNSLLKYNSDAIESLHIGEKMEEKQRKNLLSIAKKIGIKNIFEARLDSESYSIKSFRYVK
ncbi:DUF2971 domain-containing protein [Yersinia enterocolitica]|uniref:DUF2971 domain-containing protein n=1 Tax=Yersinia enterocolitica TaxID=630 RepID=UPI00065A848D|nr:DUF2971 domain-containing protein [Yersinia enterocolitica]CRY25664.1 Protein of uncharacterised function (DUF2971) [Yersinia enterocolitica]